MYNTALVAKQQMEAAGFTVDLQVLDWATLVQRRNKPELYDIFSTGFTLGADPALATSVQCNWPGWWCQEEKERILAEMLRETDPKKRKAQIERLQAVFYEDVGRVKFGDYFTFSGHPQGPARVPHVAHTSTSGTPGWRSDARSKAAE